MVEKDKDLAVLPSFRFYAYLDKGYENLLYGYDTFFDNFIEDGLHNLNFISNIRKKLLNAFIYVANMRPGDDQYNERLKIHVHINNENYSNDFFKIEKDQFKKLKEFYDFSQNYEAIEVITSPSVYECSHEYNNYIVKSYKLYENIKEQCLVDTTTPYCNIFRNIENNNPKIKNSRLICHNVKKPIYSEEERSGMQHGLAGDSAQGAEDQLSSMRPGGVSSLHASFGHEDRESSPIISSNPTAIVLPVLGLFITFFILYKFTPLGTLIHSHFVRKKINQWNADVDTDNEIFIEKYEHEDDTSQINMHNIGYNTIRNI
ncbi:PIR Superfamily Protein [Plasmodium ovale wallikeri]|uniref:PIR Superfamily Protein n=1 Tax=Plasmodium ovale wallikeri TaxID=864142 RepID=A0A1A9AR29_PLAOA|nr:PIR Superfamily Protein [Plasmodium ovale wallikeri]SBT58669.1 PIR Superfamily Protein [Plasmodium ovale wallikeri]